MATIKCVVVGDASVGKSCMLVGYTSGGFLKEYVPTVFDHYCTNMLGKTYVQLSLWDSAGHEDFDELRCMSYTSTDVFILCYSITDRDSFEHVSSKWLPEIRQHSKAPIVLVGTKLDLGKKHANNNDTTNTTNNNNNIDIVSSEEGEEMAELIEAVGFVECSALTHENLQLVFHSAMGAVICSVKSQHNARASRFFSMLGLRRHGKTNPSSLTLRTRSRAKVF